MRYINPHHKKTCRGLVHFVLWRIGYYNDKAIIKELPQDFVYPNSCEKIDHDKPTVVWINHSTFWVQAFGKSLLIDPIWNQRCSPLPFLGPKRHHPALPPIESISSLDTVIISHNHYDHLDKFTVRQLQKKYPKALWIIPKGMKKWFKRRFPLIRLKELSWWESHVHDNMALTAVPAQHFSGRGLFDRNRSLWMGCVIEFQEGKRIYFAGDTGYNPFDFKEIKKRFSEIDLSLIPIGAYKPRAFMKTVHVSPDESLQIHLDVGSKLSIGGHWGTFRLSSEGINRPPFDLYQALKASGISNDKFRVLNPGQFINW